LVAMALPFFTCRAGKSIMEVKDLRPIIGKILAACLQIIGIILI